MSEKSLIRRNAERNPSYNPYCMRCPGLVRMGRVEPFLWKCGCGAIHDERDPESESWGSLPAPAFPPLPPRLVESDTEPREPGCRCHLEVGDSPCPVHGEDTE